MTDYAELCVTTNFTFLTGASHPEELITRAAELGLSAIAITDHNSVAGVVRAFSARKELERLRREAEEAAGMPSASIRSRQVTDHSSRQSIRYAPQDEPSPIDAVRPLPALMSGVRIVLTDSPVEWLALPTDLKAWSQLTRLLSEGKRRSAKGNCDLLVADLLNWGHGMILIALPRDPMELNRDNDIGVLTRIAQAFPGQCFLGAAPYYDGRDPMRLDRLAEIGQNCGLAMVALGNVLMHRSSRRPLADVLTCLRIGRTIDTIGEHRLAHGEHRLKSGAEMARIFHRHPAAIRRTLEIADRCAFRAG